MVQIAADAALLRNGTSRLIPPEWRGCLPARAKVDEVSTFAAIGGYYEAMGAMGYIDPEPDGRDAVIGEIILRMDEIDLYNIKPLRRELFNPMSMERIDELHALVMLGVFSNLDRMLRWISASAMKTS